MENIIPIRRHGGIDILSNRYDKHSSVRAHRGTMTGETWKTFTTQQSTKQYNPPRDGKYRHYYPMAKSEDITFDRSAHERCANGHGREQQYAG
jgi:hypothetical protein